MKTFFKIWTLAVLAAAIALLPNQLFSAERGPTVLAAASLKTALDAVAADYEAEVTLVDFYRNEVLRGPGAFLEIAQGFEDYETAMRRKLEREVRPREIGALHNPGHVPPG